MAENKYVFTRMCVFRQQLTLVATTLMVFAVLLIALYERTLSSWIWFIAMLVFSVGINLLAAILYSVKKDQNTIEVRNMWRQKSYAVKSLVVIRMVRFAIPYPFNPYVKFTFNDGSSYIALLPEILAAYFRSGGVRQYLSNILAQWQRE